MKILLLALSLMATPVFAAEYVATGDWAPTRQAACQQATELAAARTPQTVLSSSCICDKGDRRYSCLATVEISDAPIADHSAR